MNQLSRRPAVAERTLERWAHQGMAARRVRRIVDGISAAAEEQQPERVAEHKRGADPGKAGAYRATSSKSYESDCEHPTIRSAN